MGIFDLMQTKTTLQAALTDRNKSAIVRYKETVVGSRGWLFFLFFEFVMFFASAMPSVLGTVLRTIFYPMLFKSVGKGVYFGKSICIRQPHKISIGRGAIIDDFAVLDAKGGDESFINIGADVTLSRGVVVSCKGGSIEIGDNTNIGISSVIHSENIVSIGANVLISSFCYLIGGGMHAFERLDVPIIAQGSIPAKGIVIEDNCWLGANVMVNDGVTVANGSIVGTSSLVNKSLEADSISYGVPAKTVRKRGAKS